MADIKKISIRGVLYNIKDEVVRKAVEMFSTKFATKRINILDEAGNTAGHLNTTSDKGLQLVMSDQNNETGADFGFRVQTLSGQSYGNLIVKPGQADLMSSGTTTVSATQNVTLHAQSIHLDTTSNVYLGSTSNPIATVKVPGTSFNVNWNQSQTRYIDSFFMIGTAGFNACYQTWDVGIHAGGAFHIRYVPDETTAVQTSPGGGDWNTYRVKVDSGTVKLRTSENTNFTVDESNKRINAVGGDFRFIFKEMADGAYTGNVDNDKEVLLSDVVEKVDGSINTILATGTETYVRLHLTNNTESTTIISLPVASETRAGTITKDMYRKLLDSPGPVINLSSEYEAFVGNSSLDVTGPYDMAAIVNATTVYIDIPDDPSYSKLPDGKMAYRPGRHDLRIEGTTGNGVYLSFEAIGPNMQRYRVILLWSLIVSEGGWGFSDYQMTAIT